MKRLFALSLIAFALSGCRQPQREAKMSGEAQGTAYHIKLVLDGTPTTLEAARREVSTTLDEIDMQMSNYREDSEISHINQQESTGWLPVSPEIARLLVIAKNVYERSDGCYDLTVKPLFDLWGFSRHENKVPAQDEIDALLPHVGMPLLEIDAVNSRIRKKDPKLKIDLSSIAQGYSVGLVAHRLEGLGIQNYLVEIGGEMTVKGRKANGDDWRVAVQTPTPLTREIEKIIDIRKQQGTAIMTAGTYQHFFEENGQTYSHILNPRTGRPVTHHLRSVTVMHDDPAWADAWDTALLCVGEEEAARIAEAEQLKVLLIYDNDGKLTEHMSKAFMAAQ
ncbi:MAG: thiamin biosynthesis protein ApbE [Methylobacter sp.]|nr:MAG: thiamin biosynthesis protein ApbE [Methylobacter sp.]